jgi:prolyl-tRNA editing enzyme YbaK/EbsC (Cys-tRNA(Pro) deacylase)
MRAVGSSAEPLPRAAARVASALASAGHGGEVRLLSDSARSAAEAAAALGVDQQQIVKSLVFRGARSGRAILALVGGRSRVETALLAECVGEPVARADADFVREQTGFAIGGVPPVGHAGALRTVAERSLVQLEQLWAAAGTPHAVFPLRGDELVALTGAQLGRIAVPSER